MNTNSKKMSIYLLLALLLIGATVTLRTVACFLHLDLETGYFREKFLITPANVIAAVGSVALFSYVFFSKRTPLRAKFNSCATYIPTGIVGCALFFLGLSLSGGFFSPVPTERGPATAHYLEIALALLALLSIVHFFLNAFLTDRHTQLRAGFSLATVLFLAVYAMYLFFNTETLPFNAPNKLVDQMAYLSTALFFLYESRISLGREKWRPYFAFGLICALLTAYSSIPSLIIYIAKGSAISLSIEESLFTFTLMIFVLSRLVMAIRLPSEDAKSGSIEIIADYAEVREIEVALRTTEYREAFATQVTIEDLVGGGIDIELDDPEDDEPNSEAEREEDFDVAHTFFEEDTLLSTDDGSQMELSYDIFETGSAEDSRGGSTR